MNAISTIIAAAPSGLQDVESRAHLFRSRVIDKLARLERWAMELLNAADCQTKVPHLLGAKLDEVRGVLRDRPELFKKVRTTELLLGRAMLHLKLRSTMAHSTLICVADIIIFEHAENNGPAGLPARLTLKACELPDLYKDLSEVVNGLAQQTNLKASAPPQPKQASATDP